MILANDNTEGIGEGLLISDAGPFFTTNGRYVIFYLSELLPLVKRHDDNASKLDIWSHKDSSASISSIAAGQAIIT